MKQPPLRILHGPRLMCAATRIRTGFTLIELMVTLMVAAILLALAIPSFRDFIISNRLATAADSIVSAIDAARMAAIKRNASAQFCSNSSTLNTAGGALDPTGQLGTGCNSGTAGPGAVYIAVTTGGTSNFSQVLAPKSDVASMQLCGSVAALRCNSQGVCSQAGSTNPYTGIVADVCSNQLSTNNNYTICMTGGTFTQIKKTTGATTCP